MANPIKHGGNLSDASARFGIPVGDWLDLSTGINPVPYPIPEIPNDVWQRLPLQSDMDALLHTARTYYGVQKDAAIAAAPGTQAILQWLPTLRPASRVCVIGPTYAEHAFCWRAAQHEVADCLPNDILNADVVVIVNPNNPDGRMWSPAQLREIAHQQTERGGWLIVDEAFGDVAPELSLVPESPIDGVIVLKSLGKFFGLAGARLGFAIGDPAIIDVLHASLGPWAVPGPTLHVAQAALQDTTWQSDTRDKLKDDSSRLDELLSGCGFRVLGGTTLFRLVQSPKATVVAEHLGRHGILVRTFDYAPDWLRFGLPGDDTDWHRLQAALDEIT